MDQTAGFAAGHSLSDSLLVDLCAFFQWLCRFLFLSGLCGGFPGVTLGYGRFQVFDPIPVDLIEVLVELSVFRCQLTDLSRAAPLVCHLKISRYVRSIFHFFCYNLSSSFPLSPPGVTDKITRHLYIVTVANCSNLQGRDESPTLWFWISFA